MPENGCLRYVVGSGAAKALRPHRPGPGSRENGHALATAVDENEEIRLAAAKRQSFKLFTTNGSYMDLVVILAKTCREGRVFWRIAPPRLWLLNEI